MDARADPALAAALAAADWPRAERLLRRAVAGKGAGAAAFYNLALVLERTGETAQAGHWLRRATQADPRHQAAWFERGRWLVGAGQFAEALAAFQTARRLDPADADAHRNAGRLAARLGLPGIAADAWRAVLALRADANEARLGLLAALIESREPEAEALRARLAADRSVRAELATLLTRGPRGHVSLDPARLG